MHCGPPSSAGWSDATYGGQFAEGKRQLGYVIGWMFSSARGSFGGEFYALGEMVAHMALIRDMYAPFEGVTLEMVGMEDCESPITHSEIKK